jgi:hypothetical protein
MTALQELPDLMPDHLRGGKQALIGLADLAAEEEKHAHRTAVSHTREGEAAMVARGQHCVGNQQPRIGGGVGDPQRLVRLPHASGDPDAGSDGQMADSGD